MNYFKAWISVRGTAPRLSSIYKYASLDENISNLILRVKDRRRDLPEEFYPDVIAECTTVLTNYDNEYSPRFEFVGRPDCPTDKARVHGENEKRLLRVLNRERIQILEERKARSDIPSAAS